MRTRTKGQQNKRMKRFRETGSMLKDSSKGSSLRRDLSKGASSVKTAFKKIKDAGKSLTRGTKDLSATRVMQSPAAGSSLIAASGKIASKKEDAPQFTKKSRLTARREAQAKRDAKAGEVNKTSGAGTANRGSRNEKARAAAKRREAWQKNKPKLSDFTSGRRTSASERKKYNEAVAAWKSNKPV